MSETNELHVPLFTNDNFHYVPWLGETDNNILRLHYDSISFTPPLNFDNITLPSLDKTFNLLDGQFATQMTSLRHRISQLHSVHTTHFNDYRTYIAFALALVNTLIIFLTHRGGIRKKSRQFIRNFSERRKKRAALRSRPPPVAAHAVIGERQRSWRNGFTSKFYQRASDNCNKHDWFYLFSLPQTDYF